MPSDLKRIFQMVPGNDEELFKQLLDKQRADLTDKGFMDQILMSKRMIITVPINNEMFDSLSKRKERDDIIHLLKSQLNSSNALQDHRSNASINVIVNNESKPNYSNQLMNNQATQYENILSPNTNFNGKIFTTYHSTNDTVICITAMISSILIVIQIIESSFIWNNISLAQNICNRMTRFQPIGTNISKLQATVEQLTQAMQSNDMTQVAPIDSRACMEYSQTKMLINNLQMEIKKSLYRLDVSAQRQVFKGIANLVVGVGNAVQLYTLFQQTSKVATIWSIATTVGLVFLTGIDVKYYMAAKKYSNELQQDINKLGDLNCQLDQLFLTI